MFLLCRVLKAQSDHRSRHEGKGSTKLIFNKDLDDWLHLYIISLIMNILFSLCTSLYSNFFFQFFCSFTLFNVALGELGSLLFFSEI